MASFSETFFQLQAQDGDNKPLGLTAEHLAQLNEQVVLKSKSKLLSDQEEINTNIIKHKAILDGFLQQHNILNPKDRNTIECKLSATNFVRKAFLIDGIDGGNYPCIYSFAFYEKMRKTTTISKLEKKGTCYQSQCFCQKCYLCDGEERTGDFKILLAFTNFNDTKIDLYMSMKGFPVLSNVKSAPSSSSEGKKKRKRKDEEEEQPTGGSGVIQASSGSSSAVQDLAPPVAHVFDTNFDNIMDDSADPNSVLPFAAVSGQEVSLPPDYSAYPDSGTIQERINPAIIGFDLHNPILWDPRIILNLPLIKQIREQLYLAHQEIGVLNKQNEKLKAENKTLKEDNERLKLNTPNNQEVNTFDLIGYQSEEKKPLLLLDDDDTSGSFSIYHDEKQDIYEDDIFSFCAYDLEENIGYK